MPATKAAATGRKPSQRSPGVLSKKVDKLADSVSEFQTLTRLGFKTISQQIDDKFAAAFGELKVQVEQHSSELKCLQADVTQELQSFDARLKKMEEASAAGVPMDTDSSGISSSGNNLSDIIKRTAREMSLQAEKAREKIICFPPTATAGTIKQTLKQILNKPQEADSWTDSKGRQFILLRWGTTHAVHSAFPMGLYNALREKDIYVNPSLTPQERQHEFDVASRVAQLFRDHPRMWANYSGKFVTAYERTNRSSRVFIDTSSYTKETLPTSLRDPSLRALVHAAKDQAARRAAATATQQPTATAAPAPAAAPAHAPTAAPAPAPTPTAAPAPAAPAPAAAPAATRPARQAPLPAQHTSTLLDGAGSERSYGESDSGEPNSEDEVLVSRRAPPAMPTRQTRQQTRQQTTEQSKQPTQPKQQKTVKPKRTAAASPATATKPAHKRLSHNGLPLFNQFAAFDDILCDDDQDTAGVPAPTQARKDCSGDGQAA